MQTKNGNGNKSKLPSDRLAYRKGIGQILEGLHTPVPERFIETKTQAGKEMRYVPWHTVCRLLDFYAPGWDGKIISIQQVGNVVVVVYQITIYTAEGEVTRQATGQESLELSFGDPICNAEAQAFKRAAAKFGLGLDLYEG